MNKKLSYREGPRDASCQLKSCQLQRNSAETICTTIPEQEAQLSTRDRAMRRVS